MCLVVSLATKMRLSSSVPCSRMVTVSGSFRFLQIPLPFNEYPPYPPWISATELESPGPFGFQIRGISGLSVLPPIPNSWDSYFVAVDRPLFLASDAGYSAVIHFGR